MRRLAWATLAVLLALVIPAAVFAAGFAVTMSRDFAVTAQPVPPRALPHPAGRIPVAVLLGANGSVATDVLGPYDVLADSSRFDVSTISTGPGPVALSGGLTTVPDYTVTDLRKGIAPSPRILIVPAWTDPAGAAEAPLREVIEQVHADGGLVVGICAGARVLVETDVLHGRKATSFWSDIDGLRHSHPETTWLAGTRWVQDGNVMTTAGVSSGILAALQLVRQFAGSDEAARIGARIAYPGWDPSATVSPAIPVRTIAAADYPYALGAVLPWLQPTYGLGLTEGVDEIDVAAAAELYGGVAFTARMVPVASGPMVTTAHGLRLLATPIDRAGDLDRLIVPGVDHTTLAAGKVPVYLPQAAARPGDSGFDPILRDIARHDGKAVAITAAKYIEYPAPPLPGPAGTPWRVLLLLGTVVLLAAAGATAPALVRRRLRRTGRGGS